MYLNKCGDAARAALFLNSVFNKNEKLRFSVLPCRSFLSKKSEEPNDKFLNREEVQLPHLKGIDDPNFSKYVAKMLSDKRLLRMGLNNYLNQFVLFYNEALESYKNSQNRRVDPKKNRIDMLFTFDTEDCLRKFEVNTDGTYSAGYSSASLKLTSEGTAMFSGNICTDIPKDGNVILAGYANMITKPRPMSFARVKKYNWTEYTHLVLKIRGDGRSYLVVLTSPDSITEFKSIGFQHPLFTRGGPYWQIVKMPFSHFIVTKNGCVMDNQDKLRHMVDIEKIGITATGVDGPFKLEIDYIGLEFDENFKIIPPYETYSFSYSKSIG